MKKKNLLALLALAMSVTLWAQGDVKFTVSVSTDSILLGNPCKVTFMLENAEAGHFEAPLFEGFAVLSGPHMSSSYSIMNGTATRRMSYSYYIDPLEVGQYYIQPASMTVGGKVHETLPLEVRVLPNPEGLKQRTEPQRQPMDWGFARDFWNNLELPAWPDIEVDFAWPDIKVSPREQDPEDGKAPAPKKKEKRKTTTL